MMTTPEVTALAQTLQPTVPLFNIIDGYRDIQSVEAVLEAQQSFSMENNTARFKQNDGPLELPDEAERIRYLGYILLDRLKLDKPLNLQIQFHSRYAWTPLILMLRAFGLQGQGKIRLNQGISLHQDSTINAAGLAKFEFEPLSDWLKFPDRVTGFLVYLIRPPGPKLQPEPEENTDAETPGILRAAPGLNVYKQIDTRV